MIRFFYFSFIPLSRMFYIDLFTPMLSFCWTSKKTFPVSCEVAVVIQVTRLNGTQFFVNAELIQIVESTPDTIISLTTNVKVIVHETAAEVVERIVEYRKKVYSSPLIYTANASKSGE